MPKNAPMEVYELNDPIYTVTVTQDGTVFDLTGSTLTFVVKATASTADASAMFTYTSADNITITDADAGTAQITFDSDDLDTPGTYHYRLDATLSDARTETLAFGPFTVQNT